MERLLSELVERLVKAHHDHLVTVVLYGSAAEPEARDALSDYNILAVLREITTDGLQRSEAVFRWWREMKNPAPVLLGMDELRAS
ncbi:MAG TPA: nucleotidyltransferase domain-containing protein, partial [Bryobacteraceae bacterium]|nr:nucleotidyltransferase domain-containing protein [Bryobacteraceae bacterium]